MNLIDWKSADSVKEAIANGIVDWDDPTTSFKDHLDVSRQSFDARRRSPILKEILEGFGLDCSVDAVEAVPHPCFEGHLKKLLKSAKKRKSGEDVKSNIPSTEFLAGEIRSDGNYLFLSEEAQGYSDYELLKRCVSLDGCDEYFYSMCRGNLEQSACTWHCKRCGQCRDWRTWHCKQCDVCNYGQSFPCPKCQPELHVHRMKREVF